LLSSFATHYDVIDLPELKQRIIQLTIKRLDQKHPEIQGNKWYKLKYNLEEAKKQKHQRLLTFGGAYSNHLFATAAAAKQAGMTSIGIIRGEETLPLNPTLAGATAAGMKLHYLSRSAYREKTSPEFINELKAAYGDFYLIPEGGTNALAIEGTKEILEEQDLGFDFICTSVGTGGTMAGLLASASPSQKVLGFSSLKGDFMAKEIQLLLDKFAIDPACNHQIINAYHFGGYGKYKPELIDFIHNFKQKTGIPLDPIYTGKMMFGIWDMIKREMIPEGSQILALHTGGLQGIRGFNLRNGTDLEEGNGCGR
jgi:1-aminocyclopropane-1-carboxylate deaminase